MTAGAATAAVRSPQAWALAYGALGWPVFPLMPASKVPAVKAWPDRASADPAAIRRLWITSSNSGVGVSLDSADLLVIGPDSADWLAEFERRGLPPTAVAESRPGHRHYIYRRPAHCPRLRLCRSGEYDILSAGAATLPPSVHPDTRRPRRWLVAPEEVGDLPEAPDWAVALLLETAERKTATLATGAPVPTAAAGDDPPIALSERGMALWRGDLALMKATDAGDAIDRSLTLFHLALELARAGLSARWIAAACQERDAALGFTKYTRRADRQTRYAELGQRATTGAAPRLVRSHGSRDTSCAELADALAEAERWRSAYDRMRQTARRRHRTLLLYEQTDAHPQFKGRQRAVGALAAAIADAARRAGRTADLHLPIGKTEHAAGLAEKQISTVLVQAEKGGAVACQRPNPRTAAGFRRSVLVSIDLPLERATDPGAVHAHLIGRTPRAPRVGKAGKTWGGARPSCRRCGPAAVVVHERTDAWRCTGCDALLQSETREVARYRNGDERPVLWTLATGPTADPRRLPPAVAGWLEAPVMTPDGPGVVALIDASGEPYPIAVALAAGGRRDYPADDVALLRQDVGGDLESPLLRQVVGVGADAPACAACGAPPTRAAADGRPLCSPCLTQLDAWFGSALLPPADIPAERLAVGDD